MKTTASVEFILLHTTKFGENSLVLHTLSREYGRRGLFVKGAGTRKSSMSLFQPLNILEAEVNEAAKCGLLPAKNFCARHPLNGIRNNLYKNAIVMFMSEVLYRSVKDGCNEDGLYEWVEGNILLLDAVETDFSNFPLRFLLEYAVRLGFSPESRDLEPFVRDHYPFVVKFMKASFAESMLLPLNGKARSEIAEGLLRYIEYHIESALHIRSLDVLHDLFA